MKDFFTFVRKLLSPPQLERKFMEEEKEIVVREYDYRKAENPDQRAWRAMSKELYGDHPCARSVVGTPQSIRSFTLLSAKQFHEHIYHPANMVLLVKGNIEEGRVRGLVEAEFKDVEAGPANTQHWRCRLVTGNLDNRTNMIDRYVATKAYQLLSVSD
ncbi:MAG: insulinase family protein [Hyphomicrobiales bacterium]